MPNLMEDFDEIGAHKLNQLREAEKSGDGVQLPFPAANIWVMNGAPNQKTATQSCPVLYYGGWATDAGKLDELLQAGHVPAGLDKWVAFDAPGDKGEWRGLGARVATAAFITHRARWISGDGRSSGPEYDAGAGLTRQHAQFLTLLYSNSKPWGYAVLTAKGYQVANVKAAIKAWEAAIAPFRKELNAATLPLSAFAISIGTYGAEPKFTPVGKGGSTSKITPIEAVIPAELSADKVRQRFIGSQHVYANAERLEQAREWLGTWKTAAREEAAAAPEPQEDSIPF